MNYPICFGMRQELKTPANKFRNRDLSFFGIAAE